MGKLVPNLFPAGVVLAYAGATAPSGFILCNGALVNRITYAALFAAIGTAHGTGDGSTTFALPDYRGRFLRGVDGGATNDPDRASRTASATGGNTGDNVGSVQADAYSSHSHNLASNNTGSGYANVGGTGLGTNPSGSFPVTYSGGNETRPKNAGVNYIIKT